MYIHSIKKIPVHTINEQQPYIVVRTIKVLPSNIEIPHRHNYHQIFFFESAKGTHEIDFNAYKTSANSIHFIGKGKVHRIDFNESCKAYLLLFPELLFKDNYAKKSFAELPLFSNKMPILQLDKKDTEEIISLLKILQAKLDRDASLEECKFFVYSLLSQLQGFYLALPNNKTSLVDIDFVNDMNLLLDAHHTEWKTVKSYTDKLGMSSAKLNRLCEQNFGMSAIKKIQDYRLVAIKRLLCYTDKQAKEIAFDFGFADVSYFSRYFKKASGQTPLDFRNSMNSTMKT